GDADQRIDVVDLILAEATIRGETIRSMAFVDVAVVQPIIVTRGIHVLAAALALSAARMNLDRDPVTNLEFVNSWAKRHHGAHVLVPRGEVLVEWIATLDKRRWAVIDDFKIRGTNRHS